MPPAPLDEKIAVLGERILLLLAFIVVGRGWRTRFDPPRASAKDRHVVLAFKVLRVDIVILKDHTLLLTHLCFCHLIAVVPCKREPGYGEARGDHEGKQSVIDDIAKTLGIRGADMLKDLQVYLAL